MGSSIQMLKNILMYWRTGLSPHKRPTSTKLIFSSTVTDGCPAPNMTQLCTCAGLCNSQKILISGIAITCFSRKHVHGGCGRPCRPSGSSRRSSGERCWRWGWSLFLQREKQPWKPSSDSSQGGPKCPDVKEQNRHSFPLQQTPEGTVYLLFWLIQIHPLVFLFIPNNLPRF